MPLTVFKVPVNRCISFDKQIIDYCTARFIPSTPTIENEFLRDVFSYLNIKDTRINTGPVSEYALRNIMHNRWGIQHRQVTLTASVKSRKHKSNQHIISRSATADQEEVKTVVPDFYDEKLNFMIELKAKKFWGSGSMSDKIDGIVRKYNPVVMKYQKPVLVVFAAGHIVEPGTSELIHNNPEYQPSVLTDFVNYSRRNGVLDWISLADLECYNCI